MPSPETALGAADQAAKVWPLSKDIRNGPARITLVAGPNMEAALSVLAVEGALTFDPFNADFLFALAGAEARLGHDSRAQGLFDLAARLHYRNRGVLASPAGEPTSQTHAAGKEQMQ